jgi:hypothetical protein
MGQKLAKNVKQTFRLMPNAQNAFKPTRLRPQKRLNQAFNINKARLTHQSIPIKKMREKVGIQPLKKFKRAQVHQAKQLRQMQQLQQKQIR